MDDWKRVVAENLTALRKSHGYTQAQLAEQLHYSDKAVSKWERGESMPDLAVMKQLADFYGILIDDLLLTEEQRQERETPPPAETVPPLPAPEPQSFPETDIPMLPTIMKQPIPGSAFPPEESPTVRKKKNHLIIAGMAALLVWFIATLIFVVLDTVLPELQYGSFLFIYAAPVTAVVCLVFNSIWFNPRWNYAIISFLMWSVLAAIFLTFYQYHIWKLFLIGIPAQLIILLWSRLRPPAKPGTQKETLP